MRLFEITLSMEVTDRWCLVCRYYEEELSVIVQTAKGISQVCVLG